MQGLEMAANRDKEAIKERIRSEFRSNLKASRMLQQAVLENGDSAMEVFFDLADDGWIQRLPEPGSVSLSDKCSVAQV